MSDTSLEKLHEIDAILAKLADGNDLTTAQAENLFTNVFVNDKEGFFFATAVAAIHAKGETVDELMAFVRVYKNLAAKISINKPVNEITDLSGTGGGTFKTINVSTAASFVVAAVGYTVGKASNFSVMSPTGSADIFATFGIDIRKLTKEQIEKSLNSIGISPFFIIYFSPRLENRAKLTLKIYRENELRVRTPFHLITNIASPFQIKHRIYGSYSPKYLEVLSRMFLKLGYEKTLTFYADIGMPEISNVGKTTIVEQNGNKIKKYTVKPSDLGVEEAKEEEIKTGGKEQNIADFVNILKGKDKGAKADLVAINAGAALYALNDVKTLKEGTKKAQKILSEGVGYKKLKDLVTKMGSIKLLNSF